MVAVRAAHIRPVVGGRSGKVAAEHVNVGPLISDCGRRRIQAVMEVDDLLDICCHAILSPIALPS
jgi:hypothetical protein